MKRKPVNYDNTPECTKCKEYLSERTIYIIDVPCYSCKTLNKVSLGRHYSVFGPDEFKKEELEYAKFNEVNLKINYSKTAEESYLSNTCPHCNSFVGNFYLYMDYFLPSVEYKQYKFISWINGYNCQKCDESKI